MKYIVLLATLYLLLLGTALGSRDLMISEVYLKGNADRLEITNIGDEPFDGILTLSGATTPGTVPEWFDLDTLTIGSGQSTVVARYGLDSYSYFGTTSVIGTINSNLTLSATGRYIQLVYQGTILDDFTIPYEMIQANNTTNSFLKTNKSGPITVATATDLRNVSTGYLANPGILLPNIQPTNPPTSGLDDLTTGGLSTCVEDAGLIQISEIFFGDEKTDSFIEIKGLADFDEPVTFSGTILALSFTNQVNITQDGFLVISRGANGLLADFGQISNPSLDLISSSGTLIISRQSGQVLDSVVIVPPTTGQSSYLFSSDSCQNTFATSKHITPGFDDKFLTYFTDENVPATVTYNSCPICSCDSINSEQLTTNNSGNSQPANPPINQPANLPIIQILGIDLTGNIGFQTITIQSNLDYPLTLVSSSPYRLHSTNRTTNNVPNGLLLPLSVSTFTGNRRFPQSANCIELLSGSEVLDKYCYNSVNSEQLTTNSEKLTLTGQAINNTGNLQPLTGNLLTSKPTTGQMLTSGTHLVSSVIDGDTFRVKYKNKTYTIRMIGIDSPESSTLRFGKKECGGKEAKQYLTDLIKGKYVHLEFDPTQATQDIYDRRLAYIFLDGENINQKIIQNGFAREFTYQIPYLFQKDFIASQKDAQNQKIGMRGQCGIGFQTIVSGENVFFTGTKNLYSGLVIQIKNILPNPNGSDKGKENITLFIDMIDEAGTDVSNLTQIDLSDGFYLLIGNTKKKLKGIVKLSQEVILTGSWSLPNKATCVSIGHDEIIYDKICYDDPVDDRQFSGDNVVLESMSTDDLFLLSQTKMQKVDDKFCIVYGGQTFDCQNIPASKTSIKLKNENKLYKNYFSFFEDYLRNDRKVLFYNTTIQNYFTLFNDAKKLLKKGSSKITIGNEIVDIFDLHSQFILKYQLPSVQEISIIMEGFVYRIPTFDGIFTGFNV